MEQVETAFDDAGNPIQLTTRMRYHNATGTGSLGSPSSAQPQARVSYVAQYPDPLGRIVAIADYGTNGASSLVRPSTIPARSDTVLVATTQFDDAGNKQSTTDPANTVSCFSYDNAGREVERILNCTMSSSSSASSGSSSSSSADCPDSLDTNVTILTAYNADGNIASVTALNSRTGNQITQYVYGTTLSDSSIASSKLKCYEIYADSVSGSDQVAFTYNRQGETLTLTDQMGAVHAYEYDLLARRTQDRVTTLASGVDGTVRRIQTDYEVRGMAQMVTSYDNATVGMGSIVNQVQLVYNEFSQLNAEYQSHGGAVSIGSTPACQYGYADGSSNTIRATTLTYPNGRVLNYSYGSAGGTADALSRLASLIDNNGSTHLADYAYLGMANVIQLTYTQPSLAYTLIGIAGGNDPDTGDIYRGYDRFSRIKDLIWTAAGSSSSSSSSSSSAPASVAERLQYGFDRVGNRLYRAELADASAQHDELYAYDGLYRLKDMQRGKLNAPRTSLVAEKFAQCWGLDELGNWDDFREDDNGDGMWDLVQKRTANPVNEITLINSLTGPVWTTPAYNAAGNMTSVPQPADPTQSYALVHDAWNRLVSVSASGTTVTACQYDGLNRRIVKQKYASGVLTETRHYFYSDRWQVVEERFDSSVDAERQFVYGQRYVDDVVLRDRDVSGTGSLSERLYVLQDANWNVTAVANLAGAIVERYGYTAYGTPTFLATDFTSRAASSFAWEVLLAGYRWDSETSLYQVRHRWLAPNVGGWMQRDPLRMLASLNLYEYANSNPICFSDFSGKTPVLIFVAAALIGGLAGASTGWRLTGSLHGAAAGAAIGVVAGVILVIAWPTSAGGGAVLTVNAQGVLAFQTTTAGAGTITLGVSASEASQLAVGLILCMSTFWPTAGAPYIPEGYCPCWCTVPGSGEYQFQGLTRRAECRSYPGCRCDFLTLPPSLPNVQNPFPMPRFSPN